MATFWGGSSMRATGYLLTHGTTLNATSYCATLYQLREEIHYKRPELLTTGVLLLHDNARPHIATVTRDLWQRFQWEVLDHTLYSPDLASSNYHLLEPLKKHLESQHFRTDIEVQQAVLTWLHDFDADFFETSFDGLVYWWNKCLDRHGDYAKK